MYMYVVRFLCIAEVKVGEIAGSSKKEVYTTTCPILQYSKEKPPANYAPT